MIWESTIHLILIKFLRSPLFYTSLMLSILRVVAFFYIMATEKQKSAWSKVGAAILNGLLVRKRCRCGSSGYSFAHHTDYDKPLDVEFKCYKCHREVHNLEHLAFLSNHPETIETDEERYALIETTWEESVHIINNECYIKGTLKTAIV